MGFAFVRKIASDAKQMFRWLKMKSVRVLCTMRSTVNCLHRTSRHFDSCAGLFASVDVASVASTKRGGRGEIRKGEMQGRNSRSALAIPRFSPLLTPATQAKVNKWLEAGLGPEYQCEVSVVQRNFQTDHARDSFVPREPSSLKAIEQLPSRKRVLEQAGPIFLWTPSHEDFVEIFAFKISLHSQMTTAVPGRLLISRFDRKIHHALRLGERRKGNLQRKPFFFALLLSIFFLVSSFFYLP